MRLAHLTDLHLPIAEHPPFLALIGKRLLGYLSWRRNRRFHHTLGALEAVVRDCRSQAPDFTAVSGDLVNISLDSEFSSAIQWLAENFDPAVTAMTLGNHDAYVRLPWAMGGGRFSPFMSGRRGSESAHRAPEDASDFPFERSVGPVSLLFANSSPPTAPGLATGRLGRPQLERIRTALVRLGGQGRCRVLVLHHPVTAGATHRRKALDDAAALRAVLADTGVELVLHGHTHLPQWASVETPSGPRPVVGGASASHAAAYGKYRPARYNIFSIDGDAAAGWRISVEARELDPADGDVKTVDLRVLLVPDPR